MLIDFNTVYDYLKQNNKTPRGVFHVGAHECEEREAYNAKGILDSDIIWVDGNVDLVAKMKSKGVPQIHYALIDEVEHEIGRAHV
jgi:hypothetical protein